ncbi:hypothetical protein C2845_PM11G16420 [Panicum miliaceum]|uniref:Uncharacterized protein n=1 Tax=Panicum miliaceum TaxID=4540 RepID=A0A3L6RPN4_PANMI|nr:hypothetical protein C2845_PM11G16420 [Panicum miliaceum]
MRVQVQFTTPRGAATSTEEYQRRNYAENKSEYNTVIGSLIAQRGNVGFRFLAFKLRAKCSTHCQAGEFSLTWLGLVSVVALTMYRGCDHAHANPVYRFTHGHILNVSSGNLLVWWRSHPCTVSVSLVT